MRAFPSLSRQLAAGSRQRLQNSYCPPPAARCPLLIVLSALLFTAVSVSAHHAFTSEFDANKPVKLRGTVGKMEWVNPHAWLHLDVKEQDGTVVKWMIEAAAPNALFRRGWTKNSLPVGTEIVVEGFRARDGTNKANGSVITYTDGRRLFVGSSGTGAPEIQEKPGNQ